MDANYLDSTIGEELLTDQFLSEILSDDINDISILSQCDSQGVTNTQPDQPQTSNWECEVCENKCNHHIYYGGRVCQSCRAFFRRAVQNKSHLLWVCKFNNECSIYWASKRKCMYCRYQKCIKIGMKPNWVSTEIDRQANIQRKLAKKTLLKSPDMCFTQEERMRICRLMHHMREYRVHALIQRYFHGNPRMRAKMTDFILGQKMELEYLLVFINEHVGPVPDFILRMAHLGELDHDVATTLSQQNFGQLFPLFGVMAMNNPDFAETAKEIRSVAQTFVQNHPDYNSFLNVFDKIQNRAQGPKYETVFPSPWAPSLEVEERHKELFQKVQEYPRAPKGSHVDKILFMLTILVSLVSVCLDRGTKDIRIENLQATYTMMLYRYLKETMGRKAYAKLMDGLMISTITKQLSEIHTHAVSFNKPTSQKLM